MTKITDQMVYIVIVKHSGGAFMPEQNVSQMDRKTVARDIADAQYDDLLQVLECNPAEGTCRDVTEDICTDAVAIWADEGEPLKDWQYEFAELHIGTAAANEFRRAA